MKRKSEDPLTAADLMRADVVRLDGDATIEEAAAALEDARIGGAAVVDAAERLVGVVSLRDLAVRARYTPGVAARGSGWSEEDMNVGRRIEDEIALADDYTPTNAERIRVRDCMSGDPITVPPNASVRRVAATLVENGIHRVFVVDGPKLVGVVSTFDLARAIAEELI